MTSWSLISDNLLLFILFLICLTSNEHGSHVIWPTSEPPVSEELFVSKLNKISETVFLVLSKKNALKNIGFNDKHLKEITKSIEN